MNTADVILELAHGAGFDLAGLAPLAPPPDGERFEAWLDAGHGADMDWLEKNRARIRDPRGLSEGSATLLVVGMGHSRPPVELPGGGRVARYAAGRDYHNRLGKGLKRLGKALNREGLLDPGRAGRAMTDAAPLLERSHAEVAGLGFASKAGNLLNPAHGPWFFLGELLLEVPFEQLDWVPSPPPGSCGTCTACIDACPTQAIVAPGQVDARLCISYQTIENRGPVPNDLRPKLSGWAFGCDVCSEVCPWGEAAPDLSDRFGTHTLVEDGPLAWLGMRDEDEFRTRANGSPLSRPGRAGLARNVATALGNEPSDAGREALLESLEGDPSALVREAAFDALFRGHHADAGVLHQLERALGRETDGELSARMQARLGS